MHRCRGGPWPAAADFGVRPATAGCRFVNYRRWGPRGPAAPPPDLRKGFAFPEDLRPEQAPPCRLEG